MAKKSPQAKMSWNQLRLAQELIKNASEDLKNDDHLRGSTPWTEFRLAVIEFDRSLKKLKAHNWKRS